MNPQSVSGSGENPFAVLSVQISRRQTQNRNITTKILDETIFVIIISNIES
jgi:hypothetical protein